MSKKLKPKKQCDVSTSSESFESPTTSKKINPTSNHSAPCQNTDDDSTSEIENDMVNMKIANTSGKSDFSPEKLPYRPRRSTRARFPSTRFLENYVSPTKSVKIDQNNSISSDNWSDIELDIAVKPTELLEDEDIAGLNSKLYSFKTPKKRDAMALAAANTPKTPKNQVISKTSRHLGRLIGTPKTPKNSNESAKIDIKTPHHVRRKIKEELERSTFNQSDSDFSGSDDSEYKPSESSSEDEQYSTDENTQSSDEFESRTKPETSKAKSQNAHKTQITSGAKRSRLRGKQEDFVLESDGYFAHHTNKKILTSNNTLDHLKTPRLPHEQLFSLLATMRLSSAHEEAITEMNTENELNFDKWLFQLNDGYNILLYGLGSKKTLLETFRTERLTDQNVIVINGFFPSLTVRTILDSITVDILELNSTERNNHEIVDEIERELKKMPEMVIYLIIHNLDGIMLRTQKDQLCLSRLAKIQKIHLLASIDHINTPFLWDYTKLNNFRFSWWNCTTMLPYTEETSFENSMMVQNTGSLALASMKNVFASLTQNTKKIFMIIIKYQLTSKGPHYQGMPYKELYHQCRQAFVVSTDMALRAQLTEFLDHHMVKIKRSTDGAENLLIPLERELLQQFLDQQETEL